MSKSCMLHVSWKLIDLQTNKRKDLSRRWRLKVTARNRHYYRWYLLLVLYYSALNILGLSSFLHSPSRWPKIRVPFENSRSECTNIVQMGLLIANPWIVDPWYILYQKRKFFEKELYDTKELHFVTDDISS